MITVRDLGDGTLSIIGDPREVLAEMAARKVPVEMQRTARGFVESGVFAADGVLSVRVPQ